MSIKVQNLDFAYDRKRQVLKDISFAIDDGKMVCLIGPNGVGKSTLFKTILGLIHCSNGKIYLDGEDTTNMSAAQIARKVAYIPQSSPVTFNYSVFEMVLMGTTAGMSMFAVPEKKERQTAEEAMEKLGISNLKNRGFSYISGGERQLALIARALCQQSKVLIMDEPTANLDYGNSTRVMQHIKELSLGGYTIIQATHQPDQAFMYADEVLAMKDGSIIAQGEPREIITKELIEELYGVQVEIESLYGDSLRVCVPMKPGDVKKERSL